MRLRAGRGTALIDEVAEPEKEHRTEREFGSGGHVAAFVCSWPPNVTGERPSLETGSCKRRNRR